VVCQLEEEGELMINKPPKQKPLPLRNIEIRKNFQCFSRAKNKAI
jgi:hypothetical protein